MKLKSFLVAALCSVVQYYDYHLFGFLAAKISKTFFYNADPINQLLKTYFVMAIAVFAKPVGAIILGRIGDIYGRFATIIISLSGTATASLIISITPGYAKIGILSAFILLLTRMIVAGLVSSGTDGVRIYVFEQIGKKRQCLGNGLITTSTQLGSLLAALSAWFFSLDIMPDYAWRYAYALGTVLGLIVILIRMKVNVLPDDNQKKHPEYELYRQTKTYRIILNNWKLFTLCFLIAGCIGSTNQFMIIFFGTYVFEILDLLPHSKMQFYTSVAISLNMVFAIIGGVSADILGKRFIATVAGICTIIVTSYMCIQISNRTFSPSVYLLICSLVPFITMPALAFLKQAIPVVIRYRIFSLAHAVGSIIISAPTAVLSTYFYKISEQSWLPLGYFITTILLMVIIVNMLHYLELLKSRSVEETDR